MLTTLKKRMSEIIGLNLISVFYQPTEEILGDNILILNFGENDKKTMASLHIACFAKAVQGNQILFTMADEYFNANYQRISDLEQEGIADNLIAHTLQVLKEKTDKVKIISACVSLSGDICIQFQNDVVIYVCPDCMFQGYEYYRFLDFKQKKNVHYIVKFFDKKIVLETRESEISSSDS